MVLEGLLHYLEVPGLVNLRTVDLPSPGLIH